MITRLEIDGLFGLYSYDLNFTNEDGSMLKIITGPNGYGKTSVMKMINALYTRDFDALFDIPFKLIRYHFDGVVLSVTQKRTFEYVDAMSDIQNIKSESLTVLFHNSDKTCEEEIEFERGGFDRNSLSQFNLFMNSRGCFFISDNRLVSYKTDTFEETSKSESLFLKDDIGRFKTILAEEKNGNKEKVNLFQDIIKKSSFADKEMQVSNMYGIRFKSKGDLGEFLDLDKLSSGEKHILLQALELIFIAQDGVVALVDEPELSLHPSWLNQYVENILKIMAVKSGKDQKFQVIIATHSPQLIGQRWDMCVDLYENRKM